MAKLTIELDPDTHDILKQLAVKDERSLTQYIQRTLRQHAGTLVVNTTTMTTTDTSNKQKRRGDLIEEKEGDPYANWR